MKSAIKQLVLAERRAKAASKRADITQALRMDERVARLREMQRALMQRSEAA